MRPLFPNHKCSGCSRKISALRTCCEECQELVETAKRAHPLPPVAPHPVGPTFVEMWDRVTPEFEQQLIDADGRYNAQMRARCESAEGLRRRALILLVAAYGIDHPLVAKLRKMEIRHVQSSSGENQVRRWREMRARAAEQSAKKERDLQWARKAERARGFLRGLGVEVGEMDDSAAVERANDAATKRRAEESRPAEGSFVNFAGRIACAEGCGGWDGRSYRCQCGAHRLNWESFGDFEDGGVCARTC